MDHYCIPLSEQIKEYIEKEIFSHVKSESNTISILQEIFMTDKSVKYDQNLDQIVHDAANTYLLTIGNDVQKNCNFSHVGKALVPFFEKFNKVVDKRQQEKQLAEELQESVNDLLSTPQHDVGYMFYEMLEHKFEGIAAWDADEELKSIVRDAAEVYDTKCRELFAKVDYKTASKELLPFFEKFQKSVNDSKRKAESDSDIQNSEKRSKKNS